MAGSEPTVLSLCRGSLTGCASAWRSRPDTSCGAQFLQERAKALCWRPPPLHLYLLSLAPTELRAQCTYLNPTLHADYNVVKLGEAKHS